MRMFLRHDVFPRRRIVGLQIRTTNAAEAAPATARIPDLWNRFTNENVSARILEQQGSSAVFAVYSAYETNEHGAYSVTIGCPVDDAGIIPEGFKEVWIPEGRYAVATTAVGPLPEIVIDGWKEIWVASVQELGGERRFEVDFEVYDARSADPLNAQVDICLGIR